MSLVHFSRIKNVGVITFRGSSCHPWGAQISEHRFNRLLLNDLFAAMARVDEELANLSTVIFTGHGRFFSNGFDLDYFKTASHSQALQVQRDLEIVMARILKLPVITVAALNGHAAAAGALFSLACDFRILNSNSVFYVPAAKLGLSYSPGFAKLGLFRLKPQVFRDVFLLSRKFTSTEALTAGIVDLVAPNEEAVMEEALRLCHVHAKPQSSMRMTIHCEVINALENATDAERDMGWSKFTSKL